ncbi:MAG: DNA polymerase III subunit delta' C-terminal domain-containing protein [Dehalococcoidia bacterium]|nr:DNA polymerase III subunit delta' C-terminal domain-containing protein [Dehalococcoidia bacterium]
MWTVIGHAKEVGLLKRAAEGGRVSHAYLIVGPPQVGKMHLALNFAQALSCFAGDRPCQICSSCTRILANKHPDVQVIGLTADDKSRDGRLHKEIRIDQIRALQHSVALLPYEGRSKVFIIDGAERLSEEASNSLLKTLEEPPPHVVLILLAANDKLLLQTVLSRCQRIDLRPLPLAVVEDALVDRWQTDRVEARKLARLSEGRLGWALSLRHDGELVQQRETRFKAMTGLLKATKNERFAAAAELANLFGRSREALDEILTSWSGWWRDLLLVKGGCQDRIANIDWADELAAIAREFSLEQIVVFIRFIQETRVRLSQNVNARLALEILLLDMPVGV